MTTMDQQAYADDLAERWERLGVPDELIARHVAALQSEADRKAKRESQREQQRQLLLPPTPKPPKQPQRKPPKQPKPKYDLTGQRFGSWTAIEYLGEIKGNTYWLCRCDCGTVRKVKLGALRNGFSPRCGACAKVAR